MGKGIKILTSEGPIKLAYLVNEKYKRGNEFSSSQILENELNPCSSKINFTSRQLSAIQIAKRLQERMKADEYVLSLSHDNYLKIVGEYS